MIAGLPSDASIACTLDMPTLARFASVAIDQRSAARAMRTCTPSNSVIAIPLCCIGPTRCYPPARAVCQTFMLTLDYIATKYIGIGNWKGHAMTRNEIDFTERMQTGRDLAQVARNKGQSTGKRAGCQYPKPTYHDVDRDSWAWLCADTRKQWERHKRRVQNNFAAACLNPINDQPNTWEF